MARRLRTLVIASDDDRGLESRVSATFGRCAYFTVVTMHEGVSVGCGVVHNPNCQGRMPGQAPLLAVEFNADVVVAGRVGEASFRALRGAGIVVATQVVGLVSDVIEASQTGVLASHFMPEWDESRCDCGSGQGDDCYRRDAARS